MKVFFKTGRSARRDHARNQRESRRFRPQMDAMLMEPRLLMAAGPLGINLAGTLGFVDLMKQTAQNWTSLTSTPLTLDSHGWPQGDAQMLVFDERVNQSFNGPDPNAVAPDIGGTYHLSFQGKATVSADFPNNYTVQNQVYNAATNTTTADLIVQHNSLDMLYLDFRNTVNPSNTSTGAGVSNVKLIQPGYAADTTQVFTTNMLNDLAPFSVLRYLNIDQANNYIPTTDSSGKLVQVDWSQRKLPNAASQLTGSSLPGQAWEYQIALANATNTDMWINIPATASDSYVAQLASLFKNGDTIDGVYYAGLNSNLKVYLEDSNEVWGGIYQPFAANLIGAETAVANGDTALTSGGVNDPSIWAQRYYMQRTMQITNIFRSAMGSDPSYAKIRPVLGWQEGNDSYYTSNFAWFESSFGAPNQYFYGMGGAIYSTPTDYSSVTNLINSLSTSFASIAANTQILATTANYYGLKTVSYEGGPDAGGGQNTAQTQVALAAERDPRMEALIQQEYSIWFAAGGNLTMVYDGPYENWTPNNQYAVLEVAQAGNPTASAKYRGFLDLSLAAPTTVTAGTTVSATGPSSIPIASDSYGFAFPTFSSGQPNFWLLNVASAGSYSLIIQTGNSSSVGQVTISLSDSNTVGTYNLGSSGTYNLTNLTLHAGLNTLAISTNGSFVPTAVTLVPASSTSSGPILQDSGFESEILSSSTRYAYDPSGTAWTYAGSAGVSGNASSFTANNPNAPAGSQVAFLQNQGTLSQVLTGWAAGTYHLSFSAAQRAYFTAQSFQVLVDGAVVGTFTPSGSAYQSLATTSFAATAGSHTIMFKGLNASGDATAFVDSITLTQDTNAPVSTATVADPSFEQLAVGSGYAYDPTATPWTFAGTAGIAGNASAFTAANPAAPYGSQVAFLQNQGTLSQVLTGWAAGTYHLSFSAAQRAYYSTQSFQVLVDGAVVGTFTPSGSAYQALATTSFAATAGSHTIMFKGLNASGDATAFLDGITINQDNTTGATLGDPSFEQLAVGSGYAYDPTATPLDLREYGGDRGQRFSLHGCQSYCPLRLAGRLPPEPGNAQSGRHFCNGHVSP